MPEMSYFLGCPHAAGHVQPSVIDCGMYMIDRMEENAEPESFSSFVAELMIRKMAPILARCSHCGFSVDWSATSFASASSAPTVMTFALPSGETNVHKVLDLQTIAGFNINGVVYELCGVIYSLPTHFVAEVKRDGVFYGYDDQNGSKLLPSHVSGSSPCFTVSTKHHDKILLNDRIAALYFVKKSSA